MNSKCKSLASFRSAAVCIVGVLLSACGGTHIELSALPNTIGAGESTTLSWQVTPMGSSTITTVTITPDIGDVAPVGSIEIYPESTTTYTLSETTVTDGRANKVTTRELTVYVDLPFDDVIEDPTLRACIRRTGAVYVHDVELLWCGGFDDRITTLSGIQYLSNLKDLFLYGELLTTLAPLAQVPSIEFITIKGGEFTSVAPLQNLPNLIGISFDNTKLSTVKPLYGLAHQLQFIWLMENQISCIDANILRAKWQSHYFGEIYPVLGNVFIEHFYFYQNEKGVLHNCSWEI